MNFDLPEKEVAEQAADMAVAIVLILALFLAGCGAGNVYGHKSGESVLIGRVSECVQPDAQHMTCTHRGRSMRFDARDMWFDRVSFENTIISPPSSDICQEMGLLCGVNRGVR